MNWFVTEISNLLGTLLFNAFAQMFLFGCLSLAGAIILVRFLNKRKCFNRATSFWTFIAKLNLVFLPILLMCWLGASGFIFGIQKTCNHWIDDASEVMIDYAAGYLPNLHEFCKQYEIERFQTVEELILSEMAVNQPELSNHYGQTVYSQFNIGLVNFVLDGLGYPRDIDLLILGLRENDFTELEASLKAGIPDGIKGYAGFYFWTLYRFLFMFFLPFFFPSLIELVIFLVYKKAKGAQTQRIAELEKEFV